MRFLGLLGAIGLLAACTSPQIVTPTTPPPAKPEPITAVYKQTDWVALPNWPGEQLTTTWPSWLNSCKKLISRPVWKDICADAVMLSPQDEASVQAFLSGILIRGKSKPIRVSIQVWSRVITSHC